MNQPDSPSPSRRKPSAAVPLPGAVRAGVSPNSQEVRERILSLAAKHPAAVSVRTVLETAQGRPIDAVTITDPRSSDADKQHVLIAAGQHGNEESARLVALRLMDYLLSPDGRPLLPRQKFVILPNVSPDAAEADTYETPAGVKPNLDHPLNDLVRRDQIIEALVNRRQALIRFDIIRLELQQPLEGLSRS